VDRSPRRPEFGGSKRGLGHENTATKTRKHEEGNQASFSHQRRGYHVTDLVPESVVTHTHQQQAGFAGIPVRDEIRLEKRLTQ
jgi:hypothetical protein